MSELSTHTGHLFTNTEHSIIYISSELQNILGGDSIWSAKVIGTPINELFKLDTKQYKNFVDKYILGEISQEVPLDIWMPENQRISTTISGNLQTNPQNKMMGIDYQIKKSSKFDAPVIIQEVDDELVLELKNFYLKRQLEGLYTFCIQWGGSQLGQYLNNVINQTAQDHGWGVEMFAEKVTLKNETLSADAHLALMIKAASYMSSTLGKTLVHKQINSVNEKTNENIFQYINRDWYIITQHRLSCYRDKTSL